MTDWRHILYLFLLSFDCRCFHHDLYVFIWLHDLYQSIKDGEAYLFFSEQVAFQFKMQFVEIIMENAGRTNELYLVNYLWVWINERPEKGNWKSSDNSWNTVVGYSANEESDVLFFCFFLPTRGETLARVDVGHISWIADEAKNEPVADRLRLASQSKGRFARE